MTTDSDGFLFSLAAPATGTPLGVALIVPDLPYASILWNGAHRLHRRSTTAEAWRQIRETLGRAIDRDTHLPDALVSLLAHDTACRVSLISRVPLTITYQTTRGQIDARLRQLAMGAAPR